MLPVRVPIDAALIRSWSMGIWPTAYGEWFKNNRLWATDFRSWTAFTA